MKKTTIVLVIIMTTLCLFNLSAEESSTTFPNEIIEILANTCPVMGGTINKAVNTIVDGRLYYFCCGGCIGAFEANPDKFQEKLKNAETRALKVTNKDGKCPVSGLEASLKFFKIDEETSTISFYHDNKSMEPTGQ